MTPEEVFEELLVEYKRLMTTRVSKGQLNASLSEWRERFAQAQPPKPERKRWEIIASPIRSNEATSDFLQRMLNDGCEFLFWSASIGYFKREIL